MRNTVLFTKLLCGVWCFPFSCRLAKDIKSNGRTKLVHNNTTDFYRTTKLQYPRKKGILSHVSLTIDASSAGAIRREV